jgi:hypothetical protein
MTYVHISSRVTAESPFRLHSVDGAPAPDGCEGTWQRYVITQGDNTIVGMRAGLRGEVSHLLEEYVERLNMRFARKRVKLLGR